MRVWRDRRFTHSVPRFQIETEIAAVPSECFDLSLSVDAHAASMAASGERAVGGVMAGRMSLGDTVTWRARHFGIWFRMTSAITAYEYPARFVDEQVRGPFARWWHEHRFQENGHGGTHMNDVIEFRSPGGPIGGVADRFVLAGYMAKLIRQRNEWLQQSLETPA
jgi:ligand-binding SRPBCC domain-containing protein